jgi:hypothetical protein
MATREHGQREPIRWPQMAMPTLSCAFWIVREKTLPTLEIRLSSRPLNKEPGRWPERDR